MRIALLGLLLAAAPAAAVPLLIPHHGRLLGDNDVPVSGTHTLTVRIYAPALTGVDPDPLWEESYPVTVTNGVYTLLIGDTHDGKAALDPADFDTEEIRYLALKVDADPEMAPWLRIGSTIYALRAGDAEALHGKPLAYFAKQQDLATLDGTVAGHTTTLGQHTTTLGQHTTALGEHATTLGGHASTLAAHDTAIGGLESDLADFETEVAATYLDRTAGGHIGGEVNIDTGALNLNDVDADLYVAGNAVVDNTLDVGAVNVSADLGVGGNINLSHDLNMSGTLGVGGPANVSGNLGVGGNLNVSGNINVSGTSSLTLAGGLRLGPTNVNCDGNAAGMIRYAAGAFQGCDGGGTWKTLTAVGPGATIVASGSGRRWSDATYARNCNEYIHPATGYLYSGITGDGVYTIDVDGTAGGGAPFDVYCDMTADGGGWTLTYLDRTNGATVNVWPNSTSYTPCTSLNANCNINAGAIPAVVDLRHRGLGASGATSWTIDFFVKKTWIGDVDQSLMQLNITGGTAYCTSASNRSTAIITGNQSGRYIYRFPNVSGTDTNHDYMISNTKVITKPTVGTCPIDGTTYQSSSSEYYTFIDYVR